MKRTLIVFLSFFSLSSGSCNDITWSFPPTTLSSPTNNASNPQVAADASGNLVGVWVENGFVVSKTKLLNMNWSSSDTLSSAAASSPLVVSDPAGNATAIWLQGGAMMASSKPFSLSWSSPVVLASSGAAYPTLAVSPSGDVIAGWTKGGNVETSTKIFGNNWNSVKKIITTNASFPRVALGGTGSSEAAVIVWNTTNGTVNAIGAATRVIVNNWGSPVIISDQTHNAGYADVAIDANGNAAAVWYLYDVNGSKYSNVTVQSSTYPLAVLAWDAPVSLSSPSMGNPANLNAQVAFDGSGNAIALWNVSFDNETFNLEAAVKPVQKEWSSPVDIVSSNLFALGAGLGVSPLNEALALYMFYNGNTLTVQSAETDTSGFMDNSWSVPILVSTGSNNGFPQVAATLSGNTLYAGTLWTAYNGTNTQVLASTGARALPLPPTNLAVSQSVNNFGFYQNYYNTLTWTASTDPTVVGYLIYRNGIFLEEVPASVLQFIDNNQVQSGHVTYGVASVNDQNDHSAIATHNF